MDAASWLNTQGTTEPIMMQLVDAGYDVYMGNNRGTPYSLGHDTWDPVTDKAQFWNYTY